MNIIRFINNVAFRSGIEIEHIAISIIILDLNSIQTGFCLQSNSHSFFVLINLIITKEYALSASKK